MLKKTKQTIPTTISLFAGAGGLDMGFSNQGFNILWANDINHDACETHKAWSNAMVVEGDIGKINLGDIPYADIILGGFPCQGFSLAGPRRLDDSRNVLYKHFVTLVQAKHPKVFIAENVKGILTLGNGSILEAIVSDFANKGYRVTTHLVNAANYNVPQDRIRVIIIGIRNDIALDYIFPQPSKTQKTIKDALSPLPAPLITDICQDAYSSRYMSRNRKRNWCEPSFTIPATAKQVPLHPSSPDMIKIEKDKWKFGDIGITRRLSYHEAAAIQTFPINMKFYGSLTSKYKQIGNAVPVNLAESLAKEMFEFLNHKNTKATH